MMVIEVFSAGYRVGSRLLKPARVIIGRTRCRGLKPEPLIVSLSHPDWANAETSVDWPWGSVRAMIHPWFSDGRQGRPAGGTGLLEVRRRC